MKRYKSLNVHWKSILRQPAKTIGLVILCVVAAFAFMYQAMQYLIIHGSVESASEYYRPVGYLEVRTETNLHEDGTVGRSTIFKDARQELIEIEDDPRVLYVNRSRRSTGFFRDFYAATEGESVSDDLNGMYLIGTAQPVWSMWEETTEAYMVRISIKIENMLLGRSDFVNPHYNYISITQYNVSDAALEKIESELQVGVPCLYRINFLFRTETTIYYQLDSLTQNLRFYPIPESGEIDWTDPDLAQVKEDMEWQEENYRATFIRTTGDMERMPDIMKDYYLTEGRLLTQEDDQEGAANCVICAGLARTRKLHVGDTIKLTLRDNHNDTSNIYSTITPRIPKSDRKTWHDMPAKDVELTIVGIVNSYDPYYSSAKLRSMVFVPDSLVPSDWSAIYGSHISSFVLRSGNDMDAFIPDCEAILEANPSQFGTIAKLKFVDNNWENFISATRPMEESSLYSTALFAVVCFLILLLAVLLYSFMCRRSLAIQRALGVPRRTALRQSFLPLAVSAALGIAAGGAAAYDRGAKKAAELLSTLSEFNVTTSQVETKTVVLLVLAVWLVLLVLGIIFLAVLCSRPVLSLLQGGAARREKAAASAASGGSPSVTVSSPAASAPASLHWEAPSGQCSSFWCSFRYVRRHILRSPFKSLLALAIAAAFTVGLAYLNQTIEKNDQRINELINTIHVKGQIAAVDWLDVPDDGTLVPGFSAEYLMDCGYAEDVHYAGTCAVTLPEDSEYELFSPIIQFFSDIANYENEDLLYIQYGRGFDADSVFFRGEAPDVIPVLASRKNLARLEAEVGDRVELLLGSDEIPVSCVIAGTYEPVDISGFLMDARAYLACFGSLEDAGITMLNFSIMPSKNREIDTIAADLEALFSLELTGLPELPLHELARLPEVKLILDDSEIQQVVRPLERTNRLLRVLYPVIAAVSVLTSVGLAAALILQCARETAIMRALGSTRRRTVAQLAAEQSVLCLVGLAVGFLLVTALLRPGNALWRQSLLCAAVYFAGCLASSLLCAAATTRRNPLELLQVKE